MDQLEQLATARDETSAWQRVLVGTDGSPGADAAVAWAAGLTRDLGARLTLVTSSEPVDAEVSPARAAELDEELERQLAGPWSAPARTEGIVPVVRVVHGAPRAALRGAIENEHADVLVVGAAGRKGTPGFLHLGSEAESLAHHVDVPLVVVPADAGTGVRSIGVHLDGSSRDGAVLDTARRIAAATGAGVLGVASADAGFDATSIGTDRTGVEVIVVDHDHAGTSFLDATTERGCDLVVVGMHAVGDVTGVRAGGIALHVLHHADVTVVLVPV